jgi:hypothetical protein
MSGEKLKKEKIVRPGDTILCKIIATARINAQNKIYNHLEQLLTEEFKSLLDKILIPDCTTAKTPLSCLRYGETSNAPKSILNATKKLSFLKELQVDKWDLSSINPNRRKFLAQLGRKSTNQILQRMYPEKKCPILICFLNTYSGGNRPLNPV